MIKQSTLLSNLQSIVGAQHAREPRDDRRYDVDGLAPKAIAEPGTYEEVAEILRFANTERLAVIPRGSGFHLLVGNIPNRYDISLSLTRLNQIVEHEPADLTVTCQAGITGKSLNDHLAKSRQMVPFAGTLSTIGGLMAINESSALLPHGMPRNFTIGLRVVAADGRLTRTGGKVVKNVAGFDLCKLYIGSLGSLAVIVEATFKVAPLQQTLQSTGLEFGSIEDLSRFTAEVIRKGLPITSVDVRRMLRADESRFVPVTGYACVISISGSEPALERSLAEMQEIAGRPGVLRFDKGQVGKRDEKRPAWVTAEFPLICQARVPPSVVPALVHAFEDEAPGPFLNIDPALGEVTGTWLGATNQPQLIDRLRSATARLGGHLVIRGCSSELKRDIDVFGPPPPSFPLMRAIKQQFDPNNVLSPGRFVGRL